MINFTYYGEIKGKGRPRFRNAGKFIQTYTDPKTRQYEATLKEAYLNAKQESFMNPAEQLKFKMKVFQPIPKSTTKKKKNEMIEGIIRPTKKPDIDNIIKSVFDSLNQVAFYDDTQIIELEVSKFYSETPRIEITIEQCEKKHISHSQTLEKNTIFDFLE